MVKHILAAYQEDIYMRLFGLEPANSNGYKVEVHEIEPGIAYNDTAQDLVAEIEELYDGEVVSSEDLNVF